MPTATKSPRKGTQSKSNQKSSKSTPTKTRRSASRTTSATRSRTSKSTTASRPTTARSKTQSTTKRTTSAKSTTKTNAKSTTKTSARSTTKTSATNRRSAQPKSPQAAKSTRARSTASSSSTRSSAAKPATALLKKPTRAAKPYTKSQLIAHLAEAVSQRDSGAVSKNQAQAFIEELAQVLITFAPVGAPLPGMGKLVLKKTPKRPARMGRNPATGESIKIAAKPAGQKLVFRLSKAAKVAAGLK